jgi:gamma-glutamyl phosphate reductase
VLKPMPPASLPEAALQAIESDNAPKLKQLLQTRGLLEARAPKGRSALWLACYHKSARRRPPARPPSMRPAPTHC